MMLSLSRLLITSMQSICLEGLGGENKVDPRLQETTFIQHTFGGHLRSKVLIAYLHILSVMNHLPIKLLFLIVFL